MLSTKFQVIWCISKEILGIYLIFAKFGKKCGVGQLPLSGALKPPVRQLRNGFSNSAQNLDSETIFKPFGLDGWFKVSYLLDYRVISQVLSAELNVSKSHLLPHTT